MPRACTGSTVTEPVVVDAARTEGRVRGRLGPSPLPIGDPGFFSEGKPLS